MAENRREYRFKHNPPQLKCSQKNGEDFPVAVCRITKKKN